ncbi:hypothetical protein AB0758_44150 [Tolypothrix bouteillei VB521301_2]|uniref:hypothetical protein n=1 Tax=Tolypothrix bouteillei TaxID=1246981 RepID=UPI0038B560F3
MLILQGFQGLASVKLGWKLGGENQFQSNNSQPKSHPETSEPISLLMVEEMQECVSPRFVGCMVEASQLLLRQGQAFPERDDCMTIKWANYNHHVRRVKRLPTRESFVPGKLTKQKGGNMKCKEMKYFIPPQQFVNLKGQAQEILQQCYVEVTTLGVACMESGEPWDIGEVLVRHLLSRRNR